MPAARAASSREDPSSTSARASIRRAARASRHRAASRRSSPAPGSCRVIAIVIRALPCRRPTTDQPRRAPRGSGRDNTSGIQAVGISCSAGRRAGTAAPRTKAFANTGSAELTAMVERVAPSILALLADGVPRTKPAIVEALADRHDKRDVVHALIRLAVTGQVEESGGRYLLAATG